MDIILGYVVKMRCGTCSFLQESADPRLRGGPFPTVHFENERFIPVGGVSLLSILPQWACSEHSAKGQGSYHAPKPQSPAGIWERGVVGSNNLDGVEAFLSEEMKAEYNRNSFTQLIESQQAPEH